jgi:hypothetical protein
MIPLFASIPLASSKTFERMIGMSVIIRVCSFIPQAEIYYSDDPVTGVDKWFQGDNRGFDPNTANTFNFRTGHEFHLDVSAGTFQPFKSTGYTTEIDKVYGTNTVISTTTGHASTDGLTETWSAFSRDSYINFHAACSVSNPLVSVAPPIKYDFDFHVDNNGLTSVTGAHTAFPAFEIYRKVNSGSWVTIYTYDPRPHNKSVADLIYGENTSVNTTA